jgi:hypothetical protein
VVEQVVDGDGAEQPALVVDDGGCHQVVRREVGGDVLEGRLGPQVADPGVERTGDQRRGWLAEQPLDVGDADQPAGGGLQRRAHDVHEAASDGVSSSLRTWASASATVASGERITGSGVIMPPAVSSS